MAPPLASPAPPGNALGRHDGRGTPNESNFAAVAM